MTPQYITGLCEGAASFSYSLSKGARPNVSPHFSLKVEKENEALIQALRDFFEAGRVYSVEAPGREYRYFRVSNNAALLRIVSHFDIYPLAGRKSLSFRPWKNMVLEKKRSPSRQDRGALFRWAQELSKRNRKNATATFKTDEEYRPYG